VLPVLNLVCYVSLCEGLRAGAGSLSYIVHVDCCGLSTIVIKKIIIIIIYVGHVMCVTPNTAGLYVLVFGGGGGTVTSLFVVTSNLVKTLDILGEYSSTR